jgi:hypothetical protein
LLIKKKPDSIQFWIATIWIVNKGIFVKKTKLAFSIKPPEN